MPNNDGPVCAEKIPIPADIKPSTSAQALKKNAQDAIQMLATKQTTSQSWLQPGKSMSQLKGQKWSQLFDFDKAMQQLRVAEYNLNQNKCGTGPIVAGSMNVKKCNQQLRQVQTLEGDDMHYFGIAPKQKALNFVVCNICSGVFTLIGFNNHMMLRHPNEWQNTSTEVDIAEVQNMLALEGKSAQSVADELVKPLMPPPPTPLPRSTKSAATTQSLYSDTAGSSSKHKNKNTGSSRARSKNKHQNNIDTYMSSTAKQQADAEVGTAVTTQVAKSSTPERQTSTHSKNCKKSSSTIASSPSKESKDSGTTKAKSSYSTSGYAYINNTQTEAKPTLKIQINTKDIKEKTTNTTSTSKRKVYISWEWLA